MQPILCHAGYPLPIKKGTFEIVGVQIAGLSIAADTRITLIDSEDFKIMPDVPENKFVIFDHKTTGNESGTISIQFKESIKVRRGVTITNSENTIAGKNIVYMR
jgi:hypothetical protein